MTSDQHKHEEFIRGLTNFCDRGSKGEAHATSENPTPPVVMPNVRARSCVFNGIFWKYSHDRRRTAEEKRSVEGRGYGRTHTHDTIDDKHLIIVKVVIFGLDTTN